MNVGEKSEFCGILGIVHLILKTIASKPQKLWKPAVLLNVNELSTLSIGIDCKNELKKTNQPTTIQLYAGYKRPTLDSKTQMDWK